MDREWFRIFVAVALLVLLPWMTVQLGSKLYAEAPSVTQPIVPSVDIKPQATAPTESPSILIPVMVEPGSVTYMALEEYVLGVVLAEMPASFETEALKAQAVAARTYTLRVLTTGGRHSGGSICAEPSCCQAYISVADYLSEKGGESGLQKVTGAVLDTVGLVLRYGGKLIDATYFSCSGGRTEDALAVWGTDVPYLQAVDSPGEEGASVFQKERFFTKDEFARLLGRELQGSPQQWLGRVTYTDGAGVATMVVGGVTYTGKELRSLLCLNSTAFQMKATQDGITVSTKGYGHRVGMSQYGAEAMAVAGHTYSEILAHYYQGTVIDKYEDLG
jgi:stage II sporulation protein D